MLVDVDLEPQIPVVIIDAMRVAPRRIGRGLYDECGFNFELFTSFENLYQFDDREKGIPSYGVVDSVEQFTALFGEILEDSAFKYAVGFTHVRRADQPPTGGWRWNKWGCYYGTHRIQFEYLYNETIDEVVVFSIVRKKE